MNDTEIRCDENNICRIQSTQKQLDVYTSAGYMLRIDCWEAEKDLKTTPGSDCALTSLVVAESLEYARLYLDGNMQMWVDAEDSLELYPQAACMLYHTQAA